jgi:hypothetical protein
MHVDGDPFPNIRVLYHGNTSSYKHDAEVGESSTGYRLNSLAMLSYHCTVISLGGSGVA